MTKSVELEQVIFNTPRQMLAMQAGVFLEDSQKYRRDFLGANTDSFSGTFSVDPNEVRLDGTPNPYFGRTYLGARFPTYGFSPLYRETARVQLAYRLDLSQEKNLLRWLGTHQVLGFGEYKNRFARRILDMHATRQRVRCPGFCHQQPHFSRGQRRAPPGDGESGDNPDEV